MGTGMARLRIELQCDGRIGVALAKCGWWSPERFDDESFRNPLKIGSLGSAGCSFFNWKEKT